MGNDASAGEYRKHPSHARLLHLVMAFTISLITISALSLLYVGFISSNTADNQAAQTEMRLFHNALKDRQNLMARDMFGMAHWDDSVKGIVAKFNQTFIRDNFASSLWYNYGQERTFLIDPQGKMVMSAREDRVDFAVRDLPPDSDFALIARKAVETHMRYRIPIGTGFSQKTVKTSDIGDISVFGLAMVDGTPAIVSAMAVVPDDEKVLLPKGNPFILISSKAVNRELMRDLNTQLAFQDLVFRSDSLGKVPLTSTSGKPLGSFDWAGANPGSHIWDVVVPAVIGLASLLAFAGLFVVRHVGGLSKALAASESRIRELALHDPLSGLPNRLQFDEALARAVASRKPFAAIACDLDRFKAVNDTYGHPAGDEVIRTVAERLKQAAGAHGLVGRVGGDEFTLLVTGFADRARLQLLASQIMMAVGMPITLKNGAVVDVGISLGVAIAPDIGETAAKIMAAADRALYASKAGGRGTALFASDIEVSEPLNLGKPQSNAA